MKSPNYVDVVTTRPSMPLKVYCDASHYEGQDKAYGGWLVCDHNGVPIDMASMIFRNSGSSTGSEVMAVTTALDALGKRPTVQHIKVYTDCKPAVHIVNNSCDISSGFQSSTVEWVPREENRIADMLANREMLNMTKKPSHYTEPKYGSTD